MRGRFDICLVPCRSYTVLRDDQERTEVPICDPNVAATHVLNDVSSCLAQREEASFLACDFHKNLAFSKGFVEHALQRREPDCVSIVHVYPIQPRPIKGREVLGHQFMDATWIHDR